MNISESELLCATRDVYVLAEKPNTDESHSTRFWSMKLAGLHQSHLRDSQVQLRKHHLRRADSKAKKRALKPTELLSALARSLGVESYEHWLEVEQPKLVEFLAEHDMTKPADLIQWRYYPGLTGPLSAQQVADRLFNSNLPLPKRIFTGVGSFLFAPRDYGRQDLDMVANHMFIGDKERFTYCEQRADEILLRATIGKDGNAPDYLDMTGRMLMLNAVSEFVGGMYNLLGSNLMMPAIGDPVLRLYNMSNEERTFYLRLFCMFRDEITSSDDGWVDVLPIPGNNNLVFLRGANGTFDWLVRDQRDKAFSSNPYYPFFKKSEMPSAMDRSELNAHLYFSTGEWAEKREHDAESRHYAEGGTAATWPGYEKLIERELIANKEYRAPSPKTGAADQQFISNRYGENCLMISPLVTIAKFFEFCDRTNWETDRQEKANETGMNLL